MAACGVEAYVGHCLFGALQRAHILGLKGFDDDNETAFATRVAQTRKTGQQQQLPTRSSPSPPDFSRCVVFSDRQRRTGPFHRSLATEAKNDSWQRPLTARKCADRPKRRPVRRSVLNVEPTRRRRTVSVETGIVVAILRTGFRIRVRFPAGPPLR